MKAKTHALNSVQFEADEKKRKVRELEAMIDDFRQMVTNLDQQIISEQEKTGISDVNHFAYPTFAKAAIQRRDNLMVSVEELEGRLEQARLEMQEAAEELTRAEQLERRESTPSREHHTTQEGSHRF